MLLCHGLGCFFWEVMKTCHIFLCVCIFTVDVHQSVMGQASLTGDMPMKWTTPAPLCLCT